jgi:hypothetical protein
MFISAARKKLNAAIEAATDPTEIAQLATALSRLIDAEGRASGRRRRQKARAQKAAKEAQPFIDMDVEFSLDEA